MEQVKSVSNDVTSVNTDGRLSEFGIGQYSSAFENAAFALTEPNQISKPFETPYGYHILKLLEIKPVSTNINDPEASIAIKDHVLQDDRLTKAKKGLIDKRLAIIKYKPALYNSKELASYTDSVLNGNKTTSFKINDKTLLFSFAKQNIRVADWVKFVKAIRSSTSSELAKKNYTDLMKEYVGITGGEYYRDHLEEYSPEYKQQIQEFKEANLLFGIMDKNVWGKANVDTTGLLSYYTVNRKKYQWAPSAEALIVTAASEQLASELQEKLKKDIKNWRTITESYGSQVTADSGRYELSQLPVIDRTDFQPFSATAPVKNQGDGTYTFNYIIQVYRNQEQRSFDDARGMIISDYQQVLEDKWISQLKKKYPVKVNEVVFAGIK